MTRVPKEAVPYDFVCFDQSGMQTNKIETPINKMTTTTHSIFDTSHTVRTVVTRVTLCTNKWDNNE